jgi:hypothetical protein
MKFYLFLSFLLTNVERTRFNKPLHVYYLCKSVAAWKFFSYVGLEFI